MRPIRRITALLVFLTAILSMAVVSMPQVAMAAWTCSGARTLGGAPGGYRLPFDGHMIITNGPGEDKHKYASSQAIDYAPEGASSFPVRAVADGTVVNIMSVSDFGTVLRIRHSDGRISFYAHLDPGRVQVSANQSVQKGQIVAYSGNSGEGGAGYHLHVEVRENWNASDVYSGTSVDIKALPTTMWCPAYPPGNPSLWSGYADSTTSGSATVIVDDQGAGFTKYGNAAYWYQASSGYNSHMWWTYSNGSTVSNYTRWQPTLPGSGNYAVSVYIPSVNATSTSARYRIYHNGVNDYVTVNQNSYYNVWVTLGTYSFAANGTEYVELTDATPECAGCSRVGFDAVRFVK